MNHSKHTPATIFVRSWTEDVVQSKQQDYVLPQDYRWISSEWYHRLWAWISFRLVRLFGTVYCRLGLHATIQNREILTPYRDTGCFLFCNHTQPVGDVVLPAIAMRPKRIYSIGSPANMGIPVIGKNLPAIGILPTPANLGQTKKFWAAVRQRVREGSCVVTFPEAHVWPYYTGIRPFPEGAFRFPVEGNYPSFSMTTTYQTPRFGRKPRVVLYLDGPFFPDPEKNEREARRDLRDQIHRQMTERSRLSDYEYVHYEISQELKGEKQ